ncbi:MAG: hypothetical protein ACRC33_24205 [Gemmataceae bacterium]
MAEPLSEVIRKLKEEMLEKYTPDELLARLTPQERLAGLSVEELLAALPPEMREAARRAKPAG